MTIRYLGDGSQFFSGIPNRDMTAEEWLEIPEVLRAEAIASGLYREESGRKKIQSAPTVAEVTNG